MARLQQQIQFVGANWQFILWWTHLSLWTKSRKESHWYVHFAQLWQTLVDFASLYIDLDWKLIIHTLWFFEIILGISKHMNDVMYLLNVNDMNEPYVATSEEVKRLWSRMVLNYFIENIQWKGISSNADNNETNENQPNIVGKYNLSV